MKVIELSRARFEQAMQAIACVCMAAWTVSIVLVELRVLA